MNAVSPLSRSHLCETAQETASYRGFEQGSRAYRRASLSLFLAGFATFSLLYCVQPLLPEFTRDYGISPGVSALALSVTTGALAMAIFASGALSQLLPRRRLMFASMALAAACNLAAACAPNWPMLLLARFAEGLVLGGVPAVAMAYLAEEVHARDLGQAMGQYVAGTAFGGMMGRVGMGLLTEWWSWRVAMGALGVLGLAAAIGFLALLPPSRRFVVQRGFDARSHVRIWGGHLRHRHLARLFAIGFLLTSIFVTLFNYAGFRLSGAPFDLGPTAVSMIFLTYISGIFVSPLAGRMADRYGRRLPLTCALLVMAAGALVTLSGSLVLIVAGILLVTIGFFATHAIASSWVGRLAGSAKSHATSLYLLSYYFGSAITGTAGGWVWQNLRWGGVVGLTAALAVLGAALAASIRERGES